MGERKIGLVYGLQVQTAWGPRPSTLLLTDQRSIFFLEGGKRAGLATALGGVAGALLVRGLSAQDQADYEGLDPEKLVVEKEHVSIPHHNLQHLRLRKIGYGASLRVKYTRPDGKIKKLKAQLSAPKEFLRKRKEEGLKRGAAFRAYAERVKEAYEKALPPGMAHRTEWRI